MAKKRAKKATESRKGEMPIFVGLHDPVALRRSLLEAAKDTVESLKQYERFNALRRERKQYIAELKAKADDISRLLAKLHQALPAFREPVEKKPKEKPQEQEDKKPEPPKKTKQDPKLKLKPAEIDELEKLEHELSQIESKLGSL